MASVTSSHRLHALDGLRGFAMILVFLNHINPSFLISAFPFLDFLGVFSSGVTGVTFLFILSGFLMYSLYPEPYTWQFIQKRYTRIFPLFLSMSCVMTVLFAFPNLSWQFKLGIMLLIALTVHGLWVYGVKKINKEIISKVLFFGFFILQIIIGGLYAFWIMRNPPNMLQHFLAPFGSTVITGLVNATLTFPLGNYVPMVDGVYWSLAAEVLFYVIYPLLLIPLILFLLKQKRIIKILFLLTLFPFLGGIDILSHHLFVLSALQPSLFYYFATGILLAYFYKNHTEKILIFSKKVGDNILLSLFIFALIFVGQHYISSFGISEIGPWMRLVFAFPATLFVALLLSDTSFLSKIFRSKFLVYIGTVSYSIYLSHAAVIEIVSSFFHSTNLSTNIVFILFSFGASVAIASFLYFLLERPYFQKKTKVAIQSHTFPISYVKSKKILAGVCVISFIAIFFAFQSNYNFFSLVVSHPKTSIVTPKIVNGPMISLAKNPSIVIQIPSTENHLGIISLALTHYQQSKKQVSSFLQVSLQEKGSTNPIAVQSYGLDEFRGVDFPFGFPQIQDSKGKIYTMTLSLSPIIKGNYLTLDTTSIKSVYQPSKSEFLKSPRRFLSLLTTKIQYVLGNNEAQSIIFLFLPFTLLSILLIVRKSSSVILK